MKGIEQCFEFYKTEGEKLLRGFESDRDKIAVGVFGNGSECFGFDDDISLDHDVTIGFTLLLNRDDEERIGFELGRAYYKACKEYMENIPHAKYSREKFGVMVTDDYFERLIGFSEIPTDYRPWLYTPEDAFAEATNGKIFEDNLGRVTKFREELKSEYPLDVRLKKLAGHLALMAQAGQYNYFRMLKRNDPGTAICISEFVRHAIPVLFLLEERFAPYYKWQLRALKQGKFGYLVGDLYTLLTTPNSQDTGAIVEKISKIVISELLEKGLSDSASDYLEDHAIDVQHHIKNRQIRALHLMEYGEN